MKENLLQRGCTPAQANHILALLRRLGIPSHQMQRWIDDLWALVAAALETVGEE